MEWRGAGRKAGGDFMKVIVSDLESQYAGLIEGKSDRIIEANGKYAPCQGCFGCWTKHPAACFMKDTLQQVCRIIGQADELVIITKNLYVIYIESVTHFLLLRASSKNSLLFSSSIER